MSKKKNDQYSCEYYVEGMHCASCELYVEKKISNIPGVNDVNAVLKSGKLYIKGEKEFTAEELTKAIEENGYKVVKSVSGSTKIKWGELFKSLIISLIIILLFFVLQRLDIVKLASTNGSITLPFIFIIGVVASLSTCMAVVGGLVLSISTHFAERGKTKPLVLFHVSRIVGFFLLGGLVGLMGSVFTLNALGTLIVNFLLFFTMMVLAVNMLDIFPFTHKLQVKMPKFVGKKVMAIGENASSILMPAVLGAATFFLPCGFTQSMQMYSLTTGNFLSGAITMLVFALGTFPVLALVSFLSTKFAASLQSGIFYKTAAFIIIFFAVFNLITSLISLGVII